MTEPSFRIVHRGAMLHSRTSHMRSRRRLLASTALLGTGLSLGMAPDAVAQNLPTGGKVVFGTVSTSQTAKKLQLTQSTRQAITTWSTFSIGNGYTVDVNQKVSNSSLLARVLGSTTSVIAGTFSSNGTVYLVNPNGIVVTPTGAVKIDRGFVGSSLDISNADYKAGRLTFAGKGASGAIVNQGSIQTKSGGYAALIGGSVENTGTIAVSLGRVGLGAGERATLDLTRDGFLQVAMPTQAPGTKALIEQSGKILAPGSQVILTAAAARDAARQAVNMSGLIEAKTASGKVGSIVLAGDNGEVLVGGRLIAGSRTAAAAKARDERAIAAERPVTRWRRSGSSAKASAKTTAGGSIVITGRAIRLAGASLDASSAGAGGTIRIGGDYQGGGTLQRSESTTIDAATTIRADATSKGNGGNIVVWSDGATRFEGLISAVGGPNGGNGGSVEVSGKETLTYLGVADLSAAKGQLGTLLLDPHNIVIADAGSTGSSTSEESYLTVQKLQEQLSLANVRILTNAPEGGGGGAITVAAPLGWTSGGRLSLEAASRVSLKAVVSPGTPGGFSTANGVDTLVEADRVAMPPRAAVSFVSPRIALFTLEPTMPALLTPVEEVRFDPSWLIPEATGFAASSSFERTLAPAGARMAQNDAAADRREGEMLINASPQNILNLLRYLDYIPSGPAAHKAPDARAATGGPTSKDARAKPSGAAEPYGALVPLRREFVRSPAPAPAVSENAVTFLESRIDARAEAQGAMLRTAFSLQGVTTWAVSADGSGAQSAAVAPATRFALLPAQSPAAEPTVPRSGSLLGPWLAAAFSEAPPDAGLFRLAESGVAADASALRASASGARITRAAAGSVAPVECFGAASLCQVD